ncbi:MAG: transposase [Methylococcales symbiont of Hymedesmia sp. n. MRB-2018]|nr:MAG: transposase [Methylococcales symbiont of Hymedesmia sp. n. MRB-2018]
MLTKSTPNTVQLNLFHSELFSQLDTKDPLIQLANTIDWSVFDNAFEKYYCQDNGRPSKPIRLMVGLLILKQLEDLSDERVVLQFKRNAYYQYFYPSRGY